MLAATIHRHPKTPRHTHQRAHPHQCGSTSPDDTHNSHPAAAATKSQAVTHQAQRFKELIGVTPKRLARTYRFAATVFAINPAGPIDWGDLAGGAGYFDQAHFGHEFRAFTGLTPTRYVEVRRRFLREHPGHALDGWPLPAD